MTSPAYILPEALEGAIEEVLGPLPLKTLAPEVAHLSAYFTSERAARPRSYLESSSQRAAYIAYFLRANFHKLEAVLEEMRPLVEAQIRKRRGFRVLDIGAGPGTMTLAAMNYLHNCEPSGPLHLLATDPNAAMLHECRRLFAAFRGRIGCSNDQAVLETRTETLEKLICDLSPYRAERENFDLIVLGNMWNEVMEAHRLSLKDQRACVEKLAGALNPGGAMVFIEPALKETSRGLHRLHDEVLRGLPHLTVFAPCVHQQACPCVAEGNEKDWCHTEQPWRPSAKVREVDRLIGNRKDALKFSYLVLRKDGKNILAVRRPSRTAEEQFACWRMVSELITEKGKRRAFLCGEGGRLQFTRLDRHATETNAVFGRMERGDIVALSQTELRPTEIRVVEQTRVEKP